MTVITSTRNSRIVEAVKLGQRKHRRRQGRFLVEGLQPIGMALDAGWRPDEAFACREQFRGPAAAGLLDALAQAGARLTEVSPHVMARLADREEPQGLVVAFASVSPHADASAFDGVGRGAPQLVVVCDRLQDPGNLGALIRTADAVGAGGLALLEPCVDAFDPKTLAAARGSLFPLPIVATDDPAALFGRLRGHRIVGADAHQGDLAWESDALNGDVALVLGNEARGLSPDVEPHIQAWVRLPIVGRAESLNVAVAGGALMYEWRRRHPPPETT